MTAAPSCAIIIPCLNEGRTIRRLVEAARIYIPTIYVVDDGSTDNTAEEAVLAGAKLLRHDQAQGKGAALQTGFTQAMADGFTMAVTMDGDGQHSPSDLPQFLNAGPGSSLVVGNRFASPGKMPRVRRWVNRWLSRRISNLTGVDLPDSQCGYRLISLRDWAALDFSCTRFEFESEVLFRFLQAGRRVQFVPVRTIYAQEQSKIHPVRDSVRWFWWWIEAQREVRAPLNRVAAQVPKEITP